MSTTITNEIATVLGTILGIFFFLPGILKLVGNNLPFWRWARQSYLRVYPVWIYYLSGVVEVVGGIGLLIPGLRFYAAIVMAILFVCLAIRPLKNTTLKSVTMTIVSLALMGLMMFLAYPGVHK